ncbi:Versiconal hemiacetal acetate esterase [Exophiala dermatitidis]
MAVEAGSEQKFPREGYRPEWLALEDASGGRYVMTGDFSVDIPTYDAVFAALSKQWPALPEELTVWDEKTDDEHGNLDVRIYQPAVAATDRPQPLPLMIYFHGGGYIAGTLDTEDAHCRYLAAKVPCLVISVNYPKAPATKMDGIIEAGAKAVPWCRNRAKVLGHDPSKTLLCGGSAGAMLASHLAYRFIYDQNDRDSITGLVLLFPVLLHWDYDGKYKYMYSSWQDNGNSGVPVFGLELAKFIWSHYDIDFNDPHHFVLLEDDLSKFPPCYIVTADKDCARDDGILLDHRLKESGVKSKLDHYPGLPHYFHVFPNLQLAHDMMAKTVEGVRFVLESQSDGGESGR